MCLRHPAVQRNNPGQQAKANHTEQPDIGTERQLLHTHIQQAQIQRAITLPQQPASNRQQQSAKTPQRKPQFALFAVAGEEHRAQGHDFGHYHEHAEVAGNDGADGGSHQHIDLQAVALHLRVAMPVNVIEADKQTAKAEGNQPNRVKRGDLHIVAYQRQRTAHANRASQYSEARGCRIQTTNRAANSSYPAT